MTKVARYRLTMNCWRFLLYLLFAVAGPALAQPSGHPFGAKKHLLPYVEAGQVPMESAAIWISDHEVAFNVRKLGVMELTQAQRNEITSGDLPDYWRYDYTRWSEVWILNIRSGEARKYADGRLGSYKDGVITIALRSFRKRKPAPGEPLEQQEYSEILEGSMGHENLVVLRRPIREHPHRCPGEPAGSKSRIRYQLKPEHGCLDIRYGEPPSLPAVYYRSDGVVVELKMSRAGIGSVPTDIRNWVAWLGAYVLKSDTGGGYDMNGELTQSVHLMKPDGQLLVLPLGVWGITGIRPTRAGIAGFYFARRPDDDGLYLWRNAEVLQVAEGFMAPESNLAYSPDGCKVSYRAYHRNVGRIARDDEYRLRVIDFCKAFSLPDDANPFVWPQATN